jgi:hypothetical protein
LLQPLNDRPITQPIGKRLERAASYRIALDTRLDPRRDGLHKAAWVNVIPLLGEDC